MKYPKELADKILKELGIGWDITQCYFCGSIIVVEDAEMECPTCNRIECTAKLLGVSGT